MLSRFAVVSLILLLPGNSAIAQEADEALVMRGLIASTVVAGGSAVVVTLDRHSPSQQPDGVVDEGFLLQFDSVGPNPLIPAGYGQVTVKAAFLAVTGQDGVVLAFVVAGREPGALTTRAAIPLVGLARYPYLAGLSHAEFVGRFSDICAPGAPMAPDCEPCDAGGIGSTQCSIGCFTGGCSVTCGVGSYACCKCVDIQPRCLCCREQGA
jgi:hypothetical protein